MEAAYDSYGQEFETYDEFKNWLNSRTTPVEEHNFCWKDKMNDAPWVVHVAPPVIPKFRLDYGRKTEERKKRKKKGKEREFKKPRHMNPMGMDFSALGDIARMKGRSSEPFRDN